MDETAGRPDGPAVPRVCRTPASSGDVAAAVQPRSAAPATWAVPGPPDTLSTVKVAGTRAWPAGIV